MSTAHFLQLLMLSAIWGASFLFTRISAPILGPTLLIEYRVTLAAVFLLLVSFFIRQKLDFKSHWKHYFILGSVNAALPFLLFAYASQTLTASLLSILNRLAKNSSIQYASGLQTDKVIK